MSIKSKWALSFLVFAFILGFTGIAAVEPVDEPIDDNDPWIFDPWVTIKPPPIIENSQENTFIYGGDELGWQFINNLL